MSQHIICTNRNLSLWETLDLQDSLATRDDSDKRINILSAARKQNTFYHEKPLSTLCETF